MSPAGRPRAVSGVLVRVEGAPKDWEFVLTDEQGHEHAAIEAESGTTRVFEVPLAGRYVSEVSLRITWRERSRQRSSASPSHLVTQSRELAFRGFESETEADRFDSTLAQMRRDAIVHVHDAAEVVVDVDGRVHIKSSQAPAQAVAMRGAMWGMLVGLLSAPFGLAMGPALSRLGIGQAVLREIGDAVSPGKAGWVLVISHVMEDEFLAIIESTNGLLVRVGLTSEQEEQFGKVSSRAPKGG